MAVQALPELLHRSRTGAGRATDGGLPLRKSLRASSTCSARWTRPFSSDRWAILDSGREHATWLLYDGAVLRHCCRLLYEIEVAASAPAGLDRTSLIEGFGPHEAQGLSLSEIVDALTKWGPEKGFSRESFRPVYLIYRTLSAIGTHASMHILDLSPSALNPVDPIAACGGEGRAAACVCQPARP